MAPSASDRGWPEKYTPEELVRRIEANQHQLEHTERRLPITRHEFRPPRRVLYTANPFVALGFLIAWVFSGGSVGRLPWWRE